MLSDVIVARIIENRWLAMRYGGDRVARYGNGFFSHGDIEDIVHSLTRRSRNDVIVIGEDYDGNSMESAFRTSKDASYWVHHLYRSTGWPPPSQILGMEVRNAQCRGSIQLLREQMPYRDDPFWDTLSPEEKLVDILDSIR